MLAIPRPVSDNLEILSEDEYLFGWDPLPGIVSVWAGREGRAIVWRREGERIVRFRETFRPWLFATSLDDLAHLGTTLTLSGADWRAIPHSSAIVSWMG